jgi:hypothetical protein
MSPSILELIDGLNLMHRRIALGWRVVLHEYPSDLG